MSDEMQAEQIEQLIGALRDDNEALRDHAIASLSQVGADAVGPLIGLMADEDVLVREAATSAIVRIGPSVVDPLIEAMDMREAQRTYEANLNVITVTRQMLGRTLDILKS